MDAIKEKDKEVKDKKEAEEIKEPEMTDAEKYDEERAKEDKDEEKDLFGNPVDGIFLTKSDVDVSVPEIIPNVVVRKSGRWFTMKKEGIRGLGTTIESAVKSFRKAWQDFKKTGNKPKKIKAPKLKKPKSENKTKSDKKEKPTKVKK